MKQIIVDNQVTSYYISEDGKCYNKKTDRYLKGQYSNSGYLNYNLSVFPDKKKRLYAHRLVAKYYLNNGEDIPQNLEVNHKDGDKNNNSYLNLELISHKDNILHAVKYDLIESKKVYCFDKNLKLLKEYKGISEVVSETGYNRSIIIQELLSDKKRITYNRCYWSYSNCLTEKDTINFPRDGKRKTVLKIDSENDILEEYSSTREAARKNFPNIKRASNHIGECCRGRIKRYKGFVWKYKEDIV